MLVPEDLHPALLRSGGDVPAGAVLITPNPGPGMPGPISISVHPRAGGRRGYTSRPEIYFQGIGPFLAAVGGALDEPFELVVRHIEINLNRRTVFGQPAIAGEPDLHCIIAPGY